MRFRDIRDFVAAALALNLPKELIIKSLMLTPAEEQLMKLAIENLIVELRSESDLKKSFVGMIGNLIKP